MTDKDIEDVFASYGQFVTGKDYALVRAIAAVVAASTKQEQGEPCPDKERTEYTCKDRHQCWEPCGELGHSEEFVQVYQQKQGEPVIGTKTWFEDGKVVTQNLYYSDVYTTPQPKQEQGVPVRGVYWKCVLCGFAHIEDECPECGHHTRAEFDFPQSAQKPMTDEQAFKLVEQDYRMEEYANAAVQLIRRTEAAHGIKE